MYQQAEDMKTTENINVNCIEPQYEYQALVSTIHPPDYWRNLGSSKSRTKQTRRSRENNYSFLLQLFMQEEWSLCWKLLF
jgi:hypothetical protein